MGFTGHATIKGISPEGNETVNIGTALQGYAAVFMDSAAIAYIHRRREEHVGTDGNTAALESQDPRLEINATFRPCSDQSIAGAGAKAILIPDGTVVTLSGFHPVKLGGVDKLNGDWMVFGDTTLTLNKDGPAEVSLVLRNYLSRQTLLSTPVT